MPNEKKPSAKRQMRHKEKKHQKQKYNRSFARRLTRWVMLLLFVMMSGLGYIIYGMSKSIVVYYSVNTFHTNMQASSRFFSSVMSDVSEAVKNHLYEVERNVGRQAEMQQAIARILQLNPRIRKCTVTGVDDPGSSSLMRLAADSDSAFWSAPFFDDSDDHLPVVAYLQPVHDGEGHVAAVLSAEMSLDFMTEQGEVMDSIFQKEIDLVKLGKKRSFQSYVLMRDGTYITHPYRWPILKGNFYSHIKDADEQGMARNVTDDMSKGLRSNDESSKVLLVNRSKSYLFYIPIEGCEWILAVTVPVLAMDLFGTMIGVFMLLAIVFMLFVTFFVSHIVIKRASKPLKQLAGAADQVAGGDFDTALPKIKSRDEIHLLRDSFENMQHSLRDYIAELQHATAAKAAMESELKIAHNIQMSMLPKIYPAFPNRDDVDIYGFVMPAKAVGGDLYDFFIRDEKLFFCIGDVSGKGVPAALVMAVTRYLFRNIAAYTHEPANIVMALNDAMSSNNDTGMFVTLFLGVLDLHTGRLDFTNAGHNPPLLLRGGEVSELTCDANIPVGVMESFSFTSQHLQLHSGNSIFLYTDGLNEAEDAEHRQFGLERVKQVALTTDDSPQCLIEAMTAAVSSFVGDAEQSDDLTMLTVKVGHITES